MLTKELRDSLLAGLQDGSIVPYLGPGVLADVRNAATGAPIPATSDELILAMNGGKPMAPKLMYEFPRAAMNVELKRGRAAVTQVPRRHLWRHALDARRAARLAQALQPPYVIDINRDTQLLDSYAGVPHLLILGCARIGGTDYRFKLFASDGNGYTAIQPEQAADRRCRSCSSRWARRGRSRATSPRTPTTWTTSPS